MAARLPILEEIRAKGVVGVLEERFPKIREFRAKGIASQLGEGLLRGAGKQLLPPGGIRELPAVKRITEMPLVKAVKEKGVVGAIREKIQLPAAAPPATATTQAQVVTKEGKVHYAGGETEITPEEGVHY